MIDSPKEVFLAIDLLHKPLPPSIPFVKEKKVSMEYLSVSLGQLIRINLYLMFHHSGRRINLDSKLVLALNVDLILFVGINPSGTLYFSSSG